MKVKEAKERLDNLKRLYDNAVKIQNYCLHNKEMSAFISKFEAETAINTSLRTFATEAAQFAADERNRISNIIDNADIKID